MAAAKLVATVITTTPEFSRVTREQARRTVQALARYVRDAGGPSKWRRGRDSSGRGRARHVRSLTDSEGGTEEEGSTSSEEEDDGDDDDGGGDGNDDDKAWHKRRVSEARQQRQFRRQLRAKAVVTAALAHISTVYHTHDFGAAAAAAAADEEKAQSSLSKIRRLGQCVLLCWPAR